MEISNRDKWTFNKGCFDSSLVFNKESLIDYYCKMMLIRTQRIFKYENLPENIPQKDLELLLQCNGNVTIAKANDGNLYAFRSGLGGVPNPYYHPTISIVANPSLKLNKQYTIDSDCVVILNDSLYQGLLRHIQHTAYLLAECDISFKFGTINARIPTIVKATDDDSYESAKEMFKKVEDGIELGLVMDESLSNGLTSYEYGKQSGMLKELIETKQYILASFYESIGIQSQFNMKREAINSSEATLNDDILFPLIDDMLEMRKIGVEKVNAMFGTNISVDLDSVWKQLREVEQMSLQEQDNSNEGGDNGTNEID